MDPLTPLALALASQEPLVYALANYKGGVGKSTIAEHLAADRGAVVVDLDLNGDTARFATMYGLESHHLFGSSAEALYDLVESTRERGKSVVIDCPPGESDLTRISLLCSDTIVTPTRPGPHDIYAMGRIFKACEEADAARGFKIEPLVICNFYRNTVVAQLYVQTLQTNPKGRYIGKIWERVEYADALENNLPVWEHRPNTPGAKEMKNLVTFIAQAAHQQQATKKAVAHG